MPPKLSFVAQNINRRMQEMNIPSVRNLEDLAGVPRDSIRNLLSGRTKMVREEKLQPICSVLDITVEELLTAHEEVHFERIPLFVVGRDQASAKEGYGVTRKNDMVFTKEWVNSIRPTKDSMLAIINVRGEGMVPSFYDGDLAIIDQSDADITQPGLYAIYLENSIVIKRARVEENSVIIESDDQSALPLSVRLQDISRLYVLGRAFVRIGKVN